MSTTNEESNTSRRLGIYKIIVDDVIDVFYSLNCVLMFTDVVPQLKKSPGKNTCQYIILHHTGGGTYASNLRILSGQSTRDASCHFLIGPEGQIAKIGEPTDIARHAGESERGELQGMNKYSIGIEIVDNPKAGDGKDRFTDKQREIVRKLVEHLMFHYKIPNENILTHASITRLGAKDKKLRDGKTPSRKVDPNRSLWVFDGKGYQKFDDYRKSFRAKSFV